MKKTVAIILTVALLLLATTACGGGGVLSGTWEGTVYEDHDEEEEYFVSLVFSGKSFTITQYATEVHSEEEEIVVEPSSGFTFYSYRFLPRLPSLMFDPTEKELSNKTSVRNYSVNIGVRENYDGKLYKETRYFERFQVISKGKYSVSEDKIEFVLSDDTVWVSDITYTENTLKIGDRDFIRSGKSRQ